MKREINKTEIIKKAISGASDDLSPENNLKIQYLVYDEEIGELNEPDIGEYIEVQEELIARKIILYRDNDSNIVMKDEDGDIEDEVYNHLSDKINLDAIPVNFYYVIDYIDSDYYGEDKIGNAYIKDVISISIGRSLGQEIEIEESTELGIPVTPYFYEGEYTGNKNMLDVSLYTFDNESLIDSMPSANGVSIKTPFAEEQKIIYSKSQKGRLKL